jgi:hypothetical protein
MPSNSIKPNEVYKMDFLDYCNYLAEGNDMTHHYEDRAGPVSHNPVTSNEKTVKAADKLMEKLNKEKSTKPKYTKELAKVSSIVFGYEGHGILTLSIMLAGKGWGQGFGGLALSQYDKQNDRAGGTVCGTDFICRILDLFGANTLEELKGRYVYALKEEGNYGGSILGLELPEPDGGKQFIISEWQKEVGIK